MHKRFLAISVLGFALLFAQGGTLLIASLCPHLQSGRVHCETRTAEPDMSHEEMGHMEMEQEVAPNPDQNAFSMGPPTNPCSHCAVHSRKDQNPASVRLTEVPQRSGDLSFPLRLYGVAPLILTPVAVLSSRAHGPPGDPTTRYILISAFRI